MLQRLIFALLFSASVLAQDNGFYAGGSIGYANLDEDEAELQTLLTDAGLTGTVDVDDDGWGWKFFGGYNFNRYIGFEAEYLDLGDADADFSITAPVAATGTVSAEGDGFTLSGVLRYPVNEQIGVFGKVGAFFWNVEGAATITGLGNVSAEDDGTDVTFGLGGRYDLNDNITLRVEWERFVDVGGSDPDLFSFGIQYNFNLP
jgi:OOP family OmpA-OmpF porin